MSEQINLNEDYLGTELRKFTDRNIEVATKHLKSIYERSCAGHEWLGWVDFPKNRGFELLDEIQNYKASIPLSYDLVLVIGIGGSYLGTKAVQNALSHEYSLSVQKPMKHLPMAFCGHHLSESSLLELIDLLDDRLPLVNVISKSGTTTEPSITFRVIRNYLETRFGKTEANRRVIVTTDKNKGSLRDFADKNQLQSFDVPDDVGGRYSVTSAVGLVPLVLAGFDAHAMLLGSDSVFRQLEDSNSWASHPAVKYASTRFSAFTMGKRIEALAYSEPKMSFVVEWWKQLFGESEGKDGQGLFPAGLCYTTDLHSMGQMMQDGYRNVFETFLRFKKANTTDLSGVRRSIEVPASQDDNDGVGYLVGQPVSSVNDKATEATKMAHFDGGVPCLELVVPSADEYGLGSLFSFFEVSCAVSALMLGVNPFDQPGVEAYKKNMYALLGKPGYEEARAELESRMKFSP